MIDTARKGRVPLSLFDCQLYLGWRRGRSFSIILVCVAWLAMQSVTAPVYAQAFLTGFEDVPLMPGLDADPAAGHVFDSPAGRIVEAYAGGALQKDSVVQFYAATLDSLGWIEETPQRYLREGEVLTIDLFGRDGDLVVRFTLAPGG